MVTTRVMVNPDVLRHYIVKSNVDAAEIGVNGLDEILAGERHPTFNQISSIAKKIHTPTGLLLLPEVVDTGRSRLQFRTVGSRPVKAMSAELRDTIAEMQNKQDFLREEAEENLSFIGKYTGVRDARVVAQRIREYLELPCPLEGGTPQEVLNGVRRAVASIGIYVFFNGKIKDNVHRKLSLDEFRGFVLSDSKAPIIFINGRDSKRGQLFTLVHETVHLFIGSEEIMEGIDYATPEEAFINAVTGEILIPQSRVRDRELRDVPSLAERYKVSEAVAVRRLYDAERITHAEYESYMDYLDSQYRRNSQQDTGEVHGNYRTALPYRIDSRFFRTVQNAVESNRITPTEALSIVGVGYKGYRVLAQKAGQ